MPEANRVLADLIRRQDRQTAAARELPALDPVYAPPLAAMAWLPQTAGLWPMSSVDNSTKDVYDVSGQGRTLTNNSAVTFAISGLVPYASFTAASTQYFSRADEAGLDITGNLWFAAWVYFNSLGATIGILNKWVGTGNQRSYRVYKDSADKIVFEISNAGVIVDGTVTSTGACAANTWHHVGAAFIQSTSLRVWLDGNATANTTSIPASIFNSTAPFELGRLTGANYLDGRMTLAGVGNAGGLQTIMPYVFQQQRWAFGR